MVMGDGPSNNLSFVFFGHQEGVKAVKDTVEGAAEIGIKYLTLYAFSTENWNRPKLGSRCINGASC